MDIIIVLDRLGYLAGEEQSPSPDLSTYQTMFDTWRHTTKLPPTEAEVLAEWDVYQSEQASTQHLRDRASAIQELLPWPMYISAMLEQGKADRDGGKTLCPALEAAVNIYEQIVTDNPEPNG